MIWTRNNLSRDVASFVKDLGFGAICNGILGNPAKIVENPLNWEKQPK